MSGKHCSSASYLRQPSRKWKLHRVPVLQRFLVPPSRDQINDNKFNFYRFSFIKFNQETLVIHNRSSLNGESTTHNIPIFMLDDFSVLEMEFDERDDIDVLPHEFVELFIVDQHLNKITGRQSIISQSLSTIYRR